VAEDTGSVACPLGNLLPRRLGIEPAQGARLIGQRRHSPELRLVVGLAAGYEDARDGRADLTSHLPHSLIQVADQIIAADVVGARRGGQRQDDQEGLEQCGMGPWSAGLHFSFFAGFILVFAASAASRTDFLPSAAMMLSILLRTASFSPPRPSTAIVPS